MNARGRLFAVSAGFALLVLSGLAILPGITAGSWVGPAGQNLSQPVAAIWLAWFFCLLAATSTFMVSVGLWVNEQLSEVEILRIQAHGNGHEAAGRLSKLPTREVGSAAQRPAA